MMAGGGAKGLPRSYREMMNTLISIDSVQKSFGSGSSLVHAFGPVSLEIEEGQFVSLLGPSGCGKSTLMLMLAGLLESTSGRIAINGKEVTAPQTDIGIMFQDNTLVPWRTVRGNVELQLEMRGLDPKVYSDRVLGLLGQVKLSDFSERFPHELSGGMQQRAAFCQAMVHSPRIMLLDEPLGKLDAMTRESIRSDLQSLWMTQRPTVLFVTHSIEEAVQLSSQVAVITPRPGRIDRLIDINLPFPRDLAVKSSAEFTHHVREIQEIFRGYGVL